MAEILTPESKWFRQVAKTIRQVFDCSVVDFSAKTVKLLQGIGMDMDQLRELFGSYETVLSKTTTPKEAEAVYCIAGLRAMSIKENERD
jgi:hypothetical protein